jgi:hypothetical protein
MGCAWQSAVGADLLATNATAQIVAVNPDDCSITLKEPVQWDLSYPVFADGHQLDVIHADHNSIWLENNEFLAPGMTVTQTKCSGTIPELHAASVDTWKERWLRHVDVPLERWQCILQFARSYLPQSEFSWAPCRVAELQEIIHRKRVKTSSGLDGVSVHDLKHMPSAALQNFCDVFAEAERTGAWPSQMINGRVACLPKVAEPKSALDFRHVTILGVLYRCWGSYHAMHALRAIDGALPTTLFGSRPGCFASQVWAQLMEH